MGIDLTKLSPDEQEQYAGLLAKGERTQERAFGEPPHPNPLTISVKRVKSAKDMADKRLRVVTQVGRANLEAGIQTPKKSPMGAAGSDQAQKAYVSAMTDPATLKRRQDNVKKVSDSEWLAMMERVGLDRYVKGTTEANYKFEQFATKYESELSRIAAMVDAMPNATFEERKARAIKQIDELAKLKGKLR